MASPVDVSFHHVAADPAVEDLVQAKWTHLATRHRDIVGGKVTLEAPHQRSSRNPRFTVKIRVEVPGQDVWITHTDDSDRSRDLAVAVREAFAAAERRLDSRTERRRGRVEHHEEHEQGDVVALFAPEGYGLIRTADGRDVYFHRNAVLDDAFSELRQGSRVSFVSYDAVEGEHASTVRVL